MFRKVVEGLEFAKDGEVRGGAESVFEFGQGSDLVAEQVLAEGLGIEGRWSHGSVRSNGGPTRFAYLATDDKGPCGPSSGGACGGHETIHSVLAWSTSRPISPTSTNLSWIATL